MTTTSRSVALYAYRLSLVTDDIVEAVRDGGPDALLVHIHRALMLPTPPGVKPVVALATALAAQIDPDVPIQDRLAWTRAFEREDIYTAPTGVPELLDRIVEAAA